MFYKFPGLRCRLLENVGHDLLNRGYRLDGRVGEVVAGELGESFQELSNSLVSIIQQYRIRIG